MKNQCQTPYCQDFKLLLLGQGWGWNFVFHLIVGSFCYTTFPKTRKLFKDSKFFLLLLLLYLSIPYNSFLSTNCNLVFICTQSNKMGIIQQMPYYICNQHNLPVNHTSTTTIPQIIIIEQIEVIAKYLLANSFFQTEKDCIILCHFISYEDILYNFSRFTW